MAEKKKNPIATAGAAMRKAAAGAGLLTDHDYLYAERVRQLFKKNDDIRDSGLTVPDDVARVTGLKYGTDPVQARIKRCRRSSAFTGADSYTATRSGISSTA